ncbi:MAG: uracil-DNA glycosylase [Deltaproteobacteria bacterium]|nr:uracil-DNA glycosylase [Deltaproteobacteria bacterium]
MASSQPGPPPRRFTCRLCCHYFVTWEPRQPHGCRAMGFKSKYLPYIEVWRISGQNCQYYRPRSK